MLRAPTFTRFSHCQHAGRSSQTSTVAWAGMRRLQGHCRRATRLDAREKKSNGGSLVAGRSRYAVEIRLGCWEDTAFRIALVTSIKTLDGSRPVDKASIKGGLELRHAWVLW
mmetsp:Transcript_1441/g.4073  ORF Transcript_1441/g.4073 Transcript_1441/m.4073 type:complete len:112 (+) Transcript_1441:395-730(+)